MSGISRITAYTLASATEPIPTILTKIDTLSERHTARVAVRKPNVKASRLILVLNSGLMLHSEPILIPISLEKSDCKREIDFKDTCPRE